MFARITMALATALLLAAPATSRAALSPYVQSFEGLTISDPAALGNDGWLVYGNVFSPDHSTYLYGYGPFPAPNTAGNAFCAIATGQGGALQGLQQLSVYSDYNNTDHGLGNQVESNVYQERTIAADDVNAIWTFQFDAKLGNLVPPSTALAFIKTLNPSAGWALTNFITADMTAIPVTWNTYTLSITITADLVGQIVQFGFANTATGYVSSGVFYDNVVWSHTGNVDVGDRVRAGGLELRPAAPNPFAATTRVGFTMPRRGTAELSLFDVGGRRVTTLFRGEADAGPNEVVWDGRTAGGELAPAGIYLCVLQTDAGRQTRTIVRTR